MLLLKFFGKERSGYESYYGRSAFVMVGYFLIFWMAALSRFTPRVKGRVLFGSMSGYAVADNAKYLYNNFNELGSDKYFITKNRQQLGLRLQDGSFPVYAYSVKGLFLQLTAEKVFFTHGVFDFFPPLIWGAEKHNLWHGVPIKEIGPAADWKDSSLVSRAIKENIYKVFGYMYYMSCDVVYCSIPEKIKDYKRYFSVSNPEVILKKQPRNEFSLVGKGDVNKLLYAPTYRKPECSPYDLKSLVTSLGVYGSDFQDLLLKNKAVLYIRPHPVEKDSAKFISLPQNVFWDFSSDLYESLSSYRVVVTDYSSIYYDCLESGVDCRFYAPDVEEYNASVGLDPKMYALIKKENIKSINSLSL